MLNRIHMRPYGLFAFIATLFIYLSLGHPGVLQAQIITTIAGSTQTGFAGDGGPATSAQLNTPQGVAVDAAGNLYIGDSFNHRVRKVTPGGIISTVAGTGVAGFSGDGGTATSAQLNMPNGIAVDGAGNLYIADYANHRIRKVDATGVISTVAGTGLDGYNGDGVAATSAQLYYPNDIAIHGGNLYIADAFNDRVRMVNASGVIATVAGTGVGGFSGDGALATNAQLKRPYGISIDAAGNLFVADFNNSVIRKINISGIISTVAGTGVRGFSGDGAAATSAQLKNPTDVTVDGSGNLYISDGDNHRIRKVDASGIITTLVGTGVLGFSGDGAVASSAQLRLPMSVAISSANLYIADQSNDRIRLVANAPLPVSLVSFTAQPLPNQTVALSWTTSLETNNKGFTIERSKDLKTFETVGQLTELSPASNALKTYTLTDLTPYSGTSYYRLSQTDLSGQLTRFPAVSVVLKEDGYGIDPNPVVSGGRFLLRLDEPLTALVSLYSTEGKLLPVQKVGVEEGKLVLRVGSGVSAGVYVLTVQERGQSRQHRLVVE